MNEIECREKSINLNGLTFHKNVPFNFNELISMDRGQSCHMDICMYTTTFLVGKHKIQWLYADKEIRDAQFNNIYISRNTGIKKIYNKFNFFVLKFIIYLHLKLIIMETLKQKISSDYLIAFKSGEKIKKNLLGVVKGEVTTIEKNLNISELPDADVIKILTKFSKNLKETIAASNDEQSKMELLVIDAYLPTQMTESEMRTAVEQVIVEVEAKTPGEIGKVMSGFNAKYAGKADGKMVSNIVRELLTQKS